MIKDLNETVELMNSADYKERFIAEYLQLKFRHNKLKTMLDNYHKGTLDFTPTCPTDILELQKANMYDYMQLLIKRAKIEEIELPE